MATESALSASGRLSLSTAQSSRGISSTDIRRPLSWLGSTDGLGQKLPAPYHFDQLTLENLAAGGQRQLAQADEILRHVVLGEPLAAKMLDQLLSANVARHGDADPLAQPSIGDGKAGDPAGPWVAQGESLDLGGIDIVTAADDEVLQAALDFQVAAGVHAAEVAGHEPTLTIEAPFGGGLVVEVAEHQRGPTAADLTHLTRLGSLIRIGGVEQPNLVASAAAATGGEDGVGGVVWMRVLVRGVLGHAVDVLRRNALCQEGGRHGGRAGRTGHVEDRDPSEA